MKIGDIYNIDRFVFGFTEVKIIGVRDTFFGKKIYYDLGGAKESMYSYNFKRRIICTHTQNN